MKKCIYIFRFKDCEIVYVSNSTKHLDDGIEIRLLYSEDDNHALNIDTNDAKHMIHTFK